MTSPKQQHMSTPARFSVHSSGVVAMLAAVLAVVRAFAALATAAAFTFPLFAATPARAAGTIRVSTAAAAVKDGAGLTWQADAYALGGARRDLTHHDVYGTTTEDALYWSERAGTAGYRIPLVNGTYKLRLLMAETDGAVPGARVFDVSAEGLAVWNGLDVVKAASGPWVKLNVVGTRTVTDGYLDVAFKARTALPPVVHGIEVTSAARVVKVMSLGDSITYGMDPSDQCPSWQASYIAPQGSYRMELGKRLTAGTFTFVGNSQNGPIGMAGGRAHEGHCGIWIADNPNTYDLLHNIDGYLSTVHPDVFVLDVGTNDLYFGAAPSTTASRLTRLLDRIAADAPNARVLVTTLCRAGHADVTDYNALLPGVVAAQQQAGHKVSLVGLAAAANLQYPADYQDPVHPNLSGYVKMGDALAAAVQSAVNAVRAG